MYQLKRNSETENKEVSFLFIIKKLGFVYTVRQSLINWPFVERFNILAVGKGLSHRCRCVEVAVVERAKYE